MFLLGGCKPYDYSNSSNDKIPLTVAKPVLNGGNSTVDKQPQSADEFKKQLEQLQAIIDSEKINKEEVAIDAVDKSINESSIILEDVQVNETLVEETLVEETPVEEAPKEATSSSGIPTITVNEGQLVSLNLKSSDPDGDKITYSFSKPLDTDGKWQTSYNDAGQYKVTITASDGKLETKQEVLVVVKDVNRAPIIGGISDMIVDEGDTITLDPKVTDPDGGTVTISYSGWMIKETKEVGYDQAGMHTVTISATDNAGDSSKKTITITVNDVNRAPQIISITNS